MDLRLRRRDEQRGRFLQKLDWMLKMGSLDLVRPVRRPFLCESPYLDEQKVRDLV